eukprot:scaffold95162_cov36-Phaeocystis_antarctica.AAC.1
MGRDALVSRITQLSMYPEDRSRALKVYQEHQQISRLRRPIRLEPSRSHRAHCALSYREGGECWHVRCFIGWRRCSREVLTCSGMLYVPPTKCASGRNNAQTP